MTHPAPGTVVDGSIVVDAGARRALCDRGVSLLPVGVVEVRGRFHRGAAVEVMTADGEVFAYPRFNGVSTLVGLSLMTAQAFFYNAIFFTYALVLTRFYGVADMRVALYIFPFALGNVLGPLLLGPLFDKVGRRRMIAPVQPR